MKKFSDYVKKAAVYSTHYQKEILCMGKVVAFNNIEYGTIESLKNDTYKQLANMIEKEDFDVDISIDEAMQILYPN